MPLLNIFTRTSFFFSHTDQSRRKEKRTRNTRIGPCVGLMLISMGNSTLPIAAMFKASRVDIGLFTMLCFFTEALNENSSDRQRGQLMSV